MTDRIRVLSREALRLAPPAAPLARMPSLPVDELFVHHSVTADYGTDYGRTARTIQQVAFSRGYVDSSYPAGIAKDGTILELRGFQWIGAHTANRNSTATALVFVCNCDAGQITDAQVRSARWLIGFVKIGGYLTTNARITPHRAVFPTACPGRSTVARLDEIRRPWRSSNPFPDLRPLLGGSSMLLYGRTGDGRPRTVLLTPGGGAVTVGREGNDFVGPSIFTPDNRATSKKTAQIIAANAAGGDVGGDED